jgi:fatty-acyl-CoA synthase
MITHASLDDTLQNRTNTLGRAGPQTEVMICTPRTSDSVAPGQVGELCARPPAVGRATSAARGLTESR